MREFWRGGIKVATAAYLSATKTLGTTGEHDIWSGSGALPQPDNAPIRIVSSSAEDSGTSELLWRLDTGDGSDQFVAATIDGTLHKFAGAPGDDDIAGLIDAINEGSRDTFALMVLTAPDLGDNGRLTIGAAHYDHVMGSGETAADLVSAWATLATANPDYNVIAVPDFDAVMLRAKTPAVEAPVPSLTLDSGDTDGEQLVVAGPPSTVAVASELDGDILLTLSEAASVVAGSDTITATQLADGAPGTGLRTVLVRYLDDAGAARTERLTLRGVLPVETDGNASGLVDVQAVTVGDTGAAVGTLTVTDATESPTTLATIAPGDSETHRVASSAGVGRSFVVVGLEAANTSGVAAHLRLRVSGPRGARLALVRTLPLGSQLAVDLSDAPLVLEPGESVRATLEGSGTTCHVALLGYWEG